ncbi:nuclear transport factor 2 family protein [Nocardia aobensis]|uniref:Nuclear transport factor 2 family protein n=1 Tax=Nocardia aobensis TaxID=257277 RepID=A0ABW6PEJ6_9NOCA
MNNSDRTAIIDFVNRYAYALDEREWATLDDVFTVDAVARYGSLRSRALVGRTAIVASIQGYLGGCGPSQHLLRNHVVNVEGDLATALCKARVYHYGAGPRAHLTPYECFGIYRDRLRREQPGWRIYERTFDVSLAVGDETILQPR